MPSLKLQERILTYLFLASGGGFQSLAFLSLQLYHPNLCLCHHIAFSLCAFIFMWLSSLSVTVSISLILKGYHSYRIRAQSNDIFLIWLHAKTLLQIRSYSQIPLLETSSYLLKGHISTCTGVGGTICMVGLLITGLNVSSFLSIQGFPVCCLLCLHYFHAHSLLMFQKYLHTSWWEPIVKFSRGIS